MSFEIVFAVLDYTCCRYGLPPSPLKSLSFPPVEPSPDWHDSYEETHCETLHHTTMHCNTLSDSNEKTHCQTLPNTAKHRNTVPTTSRQPVRWERRYQRFWRHTSASKPSAPMCDMTSSDGWHDAFIWATYFNYPHQYVCNDSHCEEHLGCGLCVCVCVSHTPQPRLSLWGTSRLWNHSESLGCGLCVYVSVVDCVCVCV